MRTLIFVFKMAMSVSRILLPAIIAAYLAEHFVTHPVVNHHFTGYPHWGTALVAGITAMVACAVTFFHARDDEQGNFQVSIFSRVAVVGVSWAFVRLAMHQDTVLEAVPFACLATAMFAAGIHGIVGIVVRSRVAGLLLYGTAAVVYLTFSFYMMGERALRFDRKDNQVNCTFETYRWCGLHRTGVRSLTNVVGQQHKYASSQFNDVSGEGVVLIAGDGQELLVSNAPFQWKGLLRLVRDQLETFLASDERALSLTEKTPAAPLPVILMIGLGIYYLGVTVDPQVRAASHETDIKVTKHLGIVVGLLALACALSFGMSVWNIYSHKAEALRTLREIAVEVDVRDFVIRDKTINSQAWYVRMGRQDFDDTDLIGAIPNLDEAPALWLDLSDTSVTDKGIATLISLDVIQVLSLKGTSVTKACQDSLGELWIQHLDLRQTEIRAQDIASEKLQGVETLQLTDPSFSERDMPPLFSMRDLRHVSIEAAGFDARALDMWKEELEEIEVEIVPLVSETEDFDAVE